MQKIYKYGIALIVLAFVIAGIFLVFLPDVMPMHFNAAGEIDRYGSKYELLFLPAMVFIAAAIFATVLIFIRKKQVGVEKTVLKAVSAAGITVIILFVALEIFILWKMAAISGGEREVEFGDIFRFISIGMGAMLAVLGNIMPKATLNSVFGLRTSWSMKNNEVWQKSQRFGGYSLVASGLLMVALGIFIPGWAALCAAFGLLVVTVVTDIIATKRIYKAWLIENSGKEKLPFDEPDI